MPAGKYTLGWENCRRAKLETEGRIRVHMIVHISIHVYIKVKSPVAQFVITLHFHVSIYDNIYF